MWFLAAAVLAYAAPPVGVAPRDLAQPQDAQLAADVAAARRLLSSIDGCSLAGIPSLKQLLSDYENRPELPLRLLAAEARYRAGNALWFRGHESKAARWLESVARLYGKEPDIQFRRIVARSHLLLGLMGRNNERKERHLQRVLWAYRNTDDVELLQTYATSMSVLAGIREASRRSEEADRLARQARELYRERIIPRLPPPDPNPTICV